jgi:hypothetical protein
LVARKRGKDKNLGTRERRRHRGAGRNIRRRGGGREERRRRRMLNSRASFVVDVKDTYQL